MNNIKVTVIIFRLQFSNPNVFSGIHGGKVWGSILEDGGSTFLQKVGTFLPIGTVQHHKVRDLHTAGCEELTSHSLLGCISQRDKEMCIMSLF
jgi:hypothetical protein